MCPALRCAHLGASPTARRTGPGGSLSCLPAPAPPRRRNRWRIAGRPGPTRSRPARRSSPVRRRSIPRWSGRRRRSRCRRSACLRRATSALRWRLPRSPTPGPRRGRTVSLPARRCRAGGIARRLRRLCPRRSRGLRWWAPVGVDGPVRRVACAAAASAQGPADRRRGHDCCWCLHRSFLLVARVFTARSLRR